MASSARMVKPAFEGGQFKRSTPGWINTGPPSNRMRLAWAAGFFDGEGCISATITVRPDRPTGEIRLRVTIGQNHAPTLDYFRNAVGVACAVQNLGQRPGMNHPIHQIQYDGRQAHEVLVRLAPYLVRKADQLDVANRLWVEGRMGYRPGARGWPQEVWDIRRSLARQLSAMKGRKSGGVRG